jgi:glutathione S-transferase
MTAPLTVIGTPVSPYVRKVLAALELKGLAWRIDPLVPFLGNDQFTRLSPLRSIPVLVEGELVLSDSTVICEYLDERHPATALMPRSAADRARARWLEEFADTRLANVLTWGVFAPAVTRPGVFKAPRDEAALARVVAADLPPVMDLLEGLAPEAGFFLGDLGTADLAVAVHFANLRWSGVAAGLERWPRAAGWVARIEAASPLARLTSLGERALATRYPDRAALFAEYGIELVDAGVTGREARRGPMTVF